MSAGKRKDRDATKPAEKKDGTSDKDRLDRRLDEALEGTFPASDPVALTDLAEPRRPGNRQD